MYIKTTTEVTVQGHFEPLISMTFPWLFHDKIRKFHDLFVPNLVHAKGLWRVYQNITRIHFMLGQNVSHLWYISIFHDFWHFHRFPWLLQAWKSVTQIPWLFQVFHDHMNPSVVLNKRTDRWLNYLVLQYLCLFQPNIYARYSPKDICRSLKLFSLHTVSINSKVKTIVLLFKLC